MLEILDGFGAHLNNLHANRVRYEAKILSLKEEGDSSSINQAYDKHVAKSDKSVHRVSLGWLRSDRTWCADIVDQWGLLCCGLAAVRHTGRHPEIWEGSFEATNTHPLRQISFQDWCKKIELFMMAADSFDLAIQNDNDIDEYKLLPALWQAMSPEQKRAAVSIVEKFGNNAWNIDCCAELVKELSVKMSDLTSLQPAIFVAMENPSHLDRGVEQDGDLSLAEPRDPEGAAIVNAVEANRAKASSGLSMFQRVPNGMTGLDLFFHQVNFRQRSYALREREHKISEHLNVCSPRTAHQRALMDIDYDKKMQGTLMADVKEGVPLDKAARVRLDNLGQIKNRTQFINNPKRMANLQARLELLESLGHAEEMAKLVSENQRVENEAALELHVPAALRMYHAGETKKRAFTREFIKSILVVAFGLAVPPKSAKKSDLLTTLKAQVELHPDKLAAATSRFLPPEDSIAEAAPAAAAAAPAAAMPPAAAAASASNAYWLYHRCISAVRTMQTKLSAIDLALLVLKVLEKIKDDGAYDSDTEAGDIEFGHYFFEAFNGSVARRRDQDFIFELGDRVLDMIDDSGLTEENLRAHDECAKMC